jgi:hypothetical protein
MKREPPRGPDDQAADATAWATELRGIAEALAAGAPTAADRDELSWFVALAGDVPAASAAEQAVLDVLRALAEAGGPPELQRVVERLTPADVRAILEETLRLLERSGPDGGG